MVKPRSQQPPPTPPGPTPPGAAKKRAIDSGGADLGRQIGEKLRTMFDGVLTEPVPEKFRALLEELERKSSKD